MPIFSSIPDPQWTINLRLSKYSEVRNSYDAAKHKGNLYEKERMPVILGYKGFLLRECRRIRPLLAYGQNTKKLQRDLLETVPEGELDQPLKSRILNEIQSKRSSVWQNVKSYKRGAPPPTGPPIEYVYKGNKSKHQRIDSLLGACLHLRTSHSQIAIS